MPLCRTINFALALCLAALERAFDLERLSPLAVVAIGGLMLSTFLTLLYEPVFRILSALTIHMLECYQRVHPHLTTGGSQ